MGKGLGSLSGKTSKGLGLDRVDKPNAKRVKGLYPTGDDAGRYGTARYPTVLEQYNYESDYARYRAGQQYFSGIGSSFSDIQSGVIARMWTSVGIRQVSAVFSKFPSKTSNDFSWVSGRRLRGDVLSARPLEFEMMRLEQDSSDPAQHRLIVDAKRLFTREQFEPGSLQLLIGDQYEDSFTDKEVEDPSLGLNGSLALTLVAINEEEQTLSFDLSRPYGRVTTPEGNIKWTKLTYSQSDPYVFQVGRYLGSSTKYYCTCPDFQGKLLANTATTAFNSTGRRFPLPPASRKIQGDYEQELVGFEKSWRDMPVRADERRECKHIHCVRWQEGNPWREPNDVPLDGNEGLIHGGNRQVATDPIGNRTFDSYFRNNTIDLNNIAQVACGVMGYNMSPRGDMAQRTDRPQLWLLENAPEPEHVRTNDIWLKRGTMQLQMAGRDGEWSPFVTLRDGTQLPIFNFTTPKSVEERIGY